jgi:hypothetical protein
VIYRPAGVHPQWLLGIALRDEGGDDDEAAVAQTQLVVHLGVGGGQDRFLGESVADAVGKPLVHLIPSDVELAGIGVQSALVAIICDG